jgi:hypothetical protein
MLSARDHILLGIPLATLKSRILVALVALRRAHPDYERT